MALSWEKISLEIKKCILLCANCHAIEHSTRYEQNVLNEVAKYQENFDPQRSKSRKPLVSKIKQKRKECYKPPKRIRPTKEELNVLLWEIPSVDIAKIYNCSDTTVIKWAKKFGLSRPKKPYVKRISWNKGKSFSLIRPPKNTLAYLLWVKPTTKIAKDYNVSDNAVSKWAKFYNLTKPPRGYWAKVNAKLKDDPSHNLN